MLITLVNSVVGVRSHYYFDIVNFFILINSPLLIANS